MTANKGIRRSIEKGRSPIIEAKNVIVGAGAMGSAAAYHFARRGEPVLLLEQFALGHDRGSSHGAARITRHSYADPRYARMTPEAFTAWRELEADAGETVYLRTGGVSFSPPGVDYAARVAANLRALEIPHWQGDGQGWNRCNRAFALPRAYDVVFEPDAGMLRAARAVALLVEMARTHGGERTKVLEQTPVLRIDLDGTRPVLVTEEARISALRLIVTAGAWVKRLLPQLTIQLKATRQQVLYLRPHDSGPFRIGQFPVFIYKGAGEEDAYYGMPEFQGLGVKVARHAGPVVDPDVSERTVSDEYVSVVRAFLRGHIPALADGSVDLREVCLYTVAPNEQFLVDFLPGRQDVIVASPCSGHGFKFAALIGRILADLALMGPSGVAIEAWRLPAVR
jgi:sarcosine oxidase